jgi:hypothetical protein
VNKFRYWSIGSRSPSGKAHILGECQTRGSMTYDSFLSEIYSSSRSK